jgi:phenylacetate-CoA ligase
MADNWIQAYYKFKIQDYEKQLAHKNQVFWQQQGEKQALKTFHLAAEQVPAYKDFLKKQKIEHSKIKTIADFKLVPTTDKQNYISYYPLKTRSWGGEIALSKITASSSGTTGNSNYWPRGGEQEFEAAINHELIYRNFFNIHKTSTLLIVGFPVGVYVSGMATVLPSWLIAQKYRINLVSTGNNKSEVLKAIKNLSPNFEQTIIIGHPFFLKDVLETGKSEGIDWKDVRIKLMMCSEGFNESWREYVLWQAGIKNKFNNCISTYGSSEMLLMGIETPLSVLIKDLVEKNPAINFKIFDRRHAPSIFQYNPTQKYIEHSGRELIFTSQSGLPLIRFNLKDSGVTFSFSEGQALLKEYHPTSLKRQIQPVWQLPFLALWGRSDQTIIFYAANIYPDHIHAALNRKKFLPLITGKFAMRKAYLKNMDEFLEINVELKNKIKGSRELTSKIGEGITAALTEINKEYNDAQKKFGKKVLPKIKLWPYNHKKYFRPGLKPKYIQ